MYELVIVAGLGVFALRSFTKHGEENPDIPHKVGERVGRLWDVVHQGMRDNRLLRAEKLKKSYLVSGGRVGLLQALLADDSEHRVMQNITQARTLLSMSRYERMCRVDQLIKSKDIVLSELLDGLLRLIDASTKQLAENNNPKLSTMLKRLQLVLESHADIDSNVSSKLVMSRLF